MFNHLFFIFFCCPRKKYFVYKNAAHIPHATNLGFRCKADFDDFPSVLYVVESMMRTWCVRLVQGQNYAEKILMNSMTDNQTALDKS